MTEERRSARVVGLLRDADGRVLAREDALPQTDVDGFSEDDLPQVRRAFAELLDVDTIVVRAVSRTLDDERNVSEIALELAPVGTIEPRPGDLWLGRNDAPPAGMTPRDRELARLVLEDPGHPLRPEWAHPGWYAEAVEWLDGSLTKIGRARTDGVAQVSNWCISSILRAPTETGDVYLKATARSPLFVDEGAVTRVLAERFPGRVPMPLAVDGVRRLMLLEDFGPPVGWKAELETKVDVISRYAALQVESARVADDLLALGMFDRRPEWLAHAIRGLLAQSPAALGLEPGERERLDGLLPTFVEGCERLAAGPLPATLVHGDLHLANIARAGDGYLFFDWTDASVGHPLMDLLLVFFEEIREIQEALRDVYLDAWIETGSRDELLDVWRLAQPLAALNQAVSYRSIVDNVEPGTGDELEPMLAWWLRKALEAAD